MAGISNKTIVNIFEKETDDDLKKNFVGVFPSNYVTRFISFHEIMIEKKTLSIHNNEYRLFR